MGSTEKKWKFQLGRGSGSRNTESTGKYRSSGSRNTENFNIEIFNITEYRKFQYWNFQYYRIPKISVLKFSILLNTEKIPIPNFNNIEIFGIIIENTEALLKKMEESIKIWFPWELFFNFLLLFFCLFLHFLVFLVISVSTFLFNN